MIQNRGRTGLCVLVLSATLPRAAGGAEWEVRGEIPHHVYGHMAAAIGNKVHYMGGCHTPDYQVLGDAHQVYDVADDSWSTAAPLPMGLGWSLPALYKGRIYLFGGGYRNPENQEICSTDKAWVYDPDSDKWAPIASLPEPRMNGLAVAVGDFIYVALGYKRVGGDADDVAANYLSTWRYDPARNTYERRADAPEGGCYIASGEHEGKIYAVPGARHEIGFHSFGDYGWVDGALVYDPGRNEWKKVDCRRDEQRLFFLTQCSTSVLLDGRLYCVGGHTHHKRTKVASYLDCETMTFVRIDDVPEGRCCGGGAIANGMLVIAGGFIGVGDTDKPCMPLWVRDVLLDAETAREGAASSSASAVLSGKISWTCGPQLIAPADRPADPYHAIKDPTVVRFEGKWHVYATIKCKDRTVMEHLSFADWKDADAAPRHPIELVKAYHCAPQLFYFRPQEKWYLIYQWGDDSRKYFGPCYSTLEGPGKPQTLTKPVMLYPEKPSNVSAWLDFWVIGDPETSKAHLFFTSLDGKMWRAETKYADFPHGWSAPEVVLEGDIFEASHTYSLTRPPARGAPSGTSAQAAKDSPEKDRPGRLESPTGKAARFLTIVEAQASGGRRYYKAYVADKLDGEWTPIADSLEKPFAGERNVRFADGVAPWTDSFSHGELLREGHDEAMAVDPARLRFLFQGCSASDRAGKGYGGFTWRLGLLEAGK